MFLNSIYKHVLTCDISVPEQLKATEATDTAAVKLYQLKAEPRLAMQGDIRIKATCGC